MKKEEKKTRTENSKNSQIQIGMCFLFIRFLSFLLSFGLIHFPLFAFSTCSLYQNKPKYALANSVFTFKKKIFLKIM